MTEYDLPFNLRLKMEYASKYTANQKSYSNTSISYIITNEEVLNTLRQLFVLTNNKFVKEVITSVGQNKRFTVNQVRIITEEMAKFENITLNF
jgi:hypothetical protein